MINKIVSPSKTIDSIKTSTSDECYRAKLPYVHPQPWINDVVLPLFFWLSSLCHFQKPSVSDLQPNKPTHFSSEQIAFRFRLLCEMHAFPALHLPQSSNTLHFFCCFPHIISLTSSNPPNTVSRHVYLALKGRWRTRCAVSMSMLIINTNLFKSTLGSCCHLVFRRYYPDGRLLLATAVYVSVTATFWLWENH